MNNNQEHLKWIYDRLVIVHNENPNVDYMVRFRKIVDDSGSSSPASERGEVADLVAKLRDWRSNPLIAERERAADLLQHQHPQPVAVSEPMPWQELAAILHEAVPDLDVLYRPCPSSEDLAADLLADTRLCILRGNALPTPEVP